MSVLTALARLQSTTKIELNYGPWVRQGFILGLWYKEFPDYMLENLSPVHNFELANIDPENKSNWYIDKIYPVLLKFQFISETGTSWHQCYRDLRSLGWNRLKVWRDGGRLQYLLRNYKVGMPEGYQHITLLLDISISTCKQIQIGTETKEVPIMKTVCEDLGDDPSELEPGEGVKNNEEFKSLMQDFDGVVRPGEVVPLIVVDDIELDAAPEPRCEHGNLSGCCGTSDCQFFMGEDDIPF